jgi:hypothetical protein
VTPSEAARVLLQRPGDLEARRVLVGAIVDAIDRGIARVLRRPTQDNDRTELANAFLYAKVLDRAFLKGIANADSVQAYAARSAQFFAKDKLRGAQGTRTRFEYVDSQAGEGIADASESDDEELDNVTEAIRSSEAAKRFEALPSDDKLLFYLVHDVPPRWAIEDLAKKRGVAFAQIEAELARRVNVHDEELGKLRDELDRRGQEIQRLQYRIASVSSDRLAKEGTDPAVLEPASPALILQMQSRRTRERATRAELLAYERHLVERVETLQELQVEGRRRLHDPEARSKRWDELLALLGALPANPVERKRAVNRITVRYKRLCARLRGGEE